MIWTITEVTEYAGHKGALNFARDGYDYGPEPALGWSAPLTSEIRDNLKNTFYHFIHSKLYLFVY